MSACFFNSLPLIVAAFSSKSFFDKTSLPVENSCLLTYPRDKAEILAFYPSIVLRFVLLDIVIDCFNFLTNTHFIKGSS